MVINVAFNKNFRKCIYFFYNLMPSEKTCFTLKHIRERESAENFFIAYLHILSVVGLLSCCYTQIFIMKS